ncbi:hypothetical protein L6164_001327 [Bauhinia variegata]|uniref:Uncharacterized protein n=1 Tax=Bauhinia variegata TaxID=167791 RepID=A0ACB9Q9S5_BAUVA|nr:hypothetical protein L6164_001327 [Bauhinia variegata]
MAAPTTQIGHRVPPTPLELRFPPSTTTSADSPRLVPLRGMVLRNILGMLLRCLGLGSGYKPPPPPPPSPSPPPKNTKSGSSALVFPN